MCFVPYIVQFKSHHIFFVYVCVRMLACVCMCVCLPFNQLINRDLFANCYAFSIDLQTFVKFWFLEFGIIYYSRLAKAYSVWIVNRISHKSHTVIRLEKIICTSHIFCIELILFSHHHIITYSIYIHHQNTQPKKPSSLLPLPPTPLPQLPPHHTVSVSTFDFQLHPVYAFNQTKTKIETRRILFLI